MKKFSAYFILITILSVLTFGCKSSKETPVSLKGKWNITSVNGKEVKTDNQPFVEFMSGNKIHAQLGCNIFNTRYQSSGDNLSFSDGQRTMMFCPYMDTEDAVLKALMQTEKYQKTDNGIAFLNANGEIVLNLVQAK